MMMELQRTAEVGFRPGAVAILEDGNEVRLRSVPYTNGREISVLAHTQPDDPVSWTEFSIDQIVLRHGHPTPAVPDE